MNPLIKKELARIKKLYAFLFERFLDDITKKKSDSPVFRNFIDGMSEDYATGQQPAEIVRDFIAGMTDQYFLRQAPEKLWPRPINL